MDNNMGPQNGQWQQPPQQGVPQQPQQGQWQQPPQQGMPQQPQQGQWQQPPQGIPPQNGQWNNNAYYGGKPPKKKKTGLIVAIIIIAVVLIAGGICAYGYFNLGWFGNNDGRKESAEYDEVIARWSREAEEEASRKASQEAEEAARKQKNNEDYAKLKEQWDAASKKQREQVEAIKNKSKNSTGNAGNTGNAGSNPGTVAGGANQKLSGTWYGPQTVSGQTVITFKGDGSVNCTFDMGAGDTITVSGVYTTDKRQYEYDDYVCHVTLPDSVRQVLPSNKFTFVVDPEIEWTGIFKEGGFGLMDADTYFILK